MQFRAIALFTLVSASIFGCAREEARPDSSVLAQDRTPSHTRGATLAVDLSSTASISADRLRTHVVYLASDELEGRGAATAGLQKAALYLAKELGSIGLKPLFGDAYQQPFEMTVGTSFGPLNKVGSLARTKEFEPLALSKSGTVAGSLVFAGFGITAPEEKYDDYVHLDVAKKIVVVLAGEADEDHKKATHHASVRAKVVRAREAKAAAILIVREKVGGARSHEAESEAGILAFEVTEKAASKLLGFDVRAERKKIDKTKTPASRAVDRTVELSADVVRDRRIVANVGALLVPPGGAGVATSTETIVIGAHYDHLGYGGSSSLAGDEKPQVHNGADDNASGTASVVEIARALATSPQGLRRRVAFLLFAGEESGLLGSSYFVKNAPMDPKSIAAMINLDMVGRLRDEKLNVMGVKTGIELPQLARRFVEGAKLKGSFGGDGYGPSDHTSFYAAGVPVLFFFTGAHEDYHKPSDDAETLNYAGMARVANAAADIVRALASAEDRVRYMSAPPPEVMRGSGYGPYFGSIPDFGESQGGVLLAGVRPQSPADKAGLRKGDLLVRFHGIEVKSLEDFTVALRDCTPGQVVDVEYMRDGKKVAVKAKLERRQ